MDSSIDGNRSKGEGGALFRRTHNIDGSSPSRPKRKADAKTIRKGGESDLRRSALRAGRKIEGVCGQNNLFVVARHGTRDNGKAENLNHRGMGVLRHRQDNAIGLRRFRSILVMIVTVVRAVGVLVCASGPAYGS